MVVIQIKAKIATKIKRRDADSSTLAPADVVSVASGAVFEGEILAARGESYGFKFSKASGAINVGEIWYYYGPHFEKVVAVGELAVSATPDEIKLDVRYYAQCDSRDDGYRYCNSHSNAMLLSVLLPTFHDESLKAGFEQAEQAYIDNLLLEGDTTDHDAQTRTLAGYGIESYWTQTLSPADVQMSLKAGIPVVAGFAYKGSGHIVVIVGMTANGWLVNDSYGSRAGVEDFYPATSTDAGREGAYDTYTQQVMDTVFWDQDDSGKKECGWGRVVTAIKGVPTGLPKGL